ncbi:MAG TPA: LacI family DNA-binding transcriptional regulator [Jatrophihabitantaceae bacterium]|nr:LacI family DNA-binding transcriptional regulator [Jatrophihabitantaceae bacterium]
MVASRPAGNRPTLRQVAALSGVSLKTASRALNGEQYVSAATADKVHAAAAQLGFRRNAIARDLRAGARSSLVGLIISDLSNPFFSRVARGAERRLRAAGLQLISASSNEDPTLEQTLITEMFERRVSALLIVTSADSHAYLDAERRLGLPVVFLDREPADIVADAVVLDNDGGMRRAVAHLLSRGHERVGLVGDLARLSTQRERVAAFESALSAAGVPDWHRYVRADCHDAATAERAVRSVLAESPPPTALITTNNLITTGALRALRDTPPADRPALVGFDDFDLADVLGVTVVAHDPERMGELGAAQILARLNGTDGPAQRLVLPTELIERGSAEARR